MSPAARLGLRFASPLEGVRFAAPLQCSAAASSSARGFHSSLRAGQRRTVKQSLQQRGFSSSSSRAAETTASPSTQARSAPPWYRSPTFLFLSTIPIFTAYLGWWQLDRLKWKLSLIEELDDKLRKAPLTLPKNINLSVLPQFSYRLVELTGHFDPASDRVIFLGPRVRDGSVGYHVVMPFHRDGGGPPVMIDRGFVAQDKLIGEGTERRLKWSDSNQNRTILTVLPKLSPPNYFTPANDPSKNTWFHADAEQMAAYLSSSDNRESSHANGVRALFSSTPETVVPVLLEQVFDGSNAAAAAHVTAGEPIGRAPTIELRNQHATYAMTWFSLSAATASMLVFLARRGR